MVSMAKWAQFPSICSALALRALLEVNIPRAENKLVPSCPTGLGERLNEVPAVLWQHSGSWLGSFKKRAWGCSLLVQH